jgi:hypothetical protein
MFKIDLTITNPMTGETRNLRYQFDPATMAQAKWTAAYPTVQTAIDALVTAATNEPPKW